MAKRAYKPTKLKQLEGFRGHHPKPGNEPEPNPTMPDRPSHLDAVAKETWNRLGPKLNELGLLTEVDGDNFAILCQIRSRIIACEKFLNEENQSLVQETIRPRPDGGEHREMKESPYSKMARLYYQLFRMYAKEFGLTPVGRVGLAFKSKDEEDDELI